eukprot:6185814-Pleurochrysis_carterae.AAC.8
MKQGGAAGWTGWRGSMEATHAPRWRQTVHRETSCLTPASCQPGQVALYIPIRFVSHPQNALVAHADLGTDSVVPIPLVSARRRRGERSSRERDFGTGCERLWRSAQGVEGIVERDDLSGVWT